MIKRTQLIITISITVAILVLFIIVAIVIYSPYYQGFEAGLKYLSPDLSENRTVLRDRVYLPKKTVIKFVFEKKYNRIKYDSEQFYSFIENVEVQIWNENEYFTFNAINIELPDINSDLFEVKIGELSGSGNYSISISSDLAVNPAYHIGLGIGREMRFSPLGRNNRRFY